MIPHSPLAKRIYLVRHAQAEHNVFSDWEIRDPSLTKVGRRQASTLHPQTRDTVQLTADLIVCSPLRRTMETMILGFPELKTRLEAEQRPVILLDLLQEASDLPCDTPLYPREELAASNDGMFADLDFSTLSEDYASKQGIFTDDVPTLQHRAKLARQWLRARPEKDIVVVAHGDILRYMVDGKHSSRPWRNAELMEFTFLSEDDEDALLVQPEAQPRL